MAEEEEEEEERYIARHRRTARIARCVRQAKSPGSPNHLPAKRADQFQIYGSAALISNLEFATARKKRRLSFLAFEAPGERRKLPGFCQRTYRSIKARYAVLLHNGFFACRSRIGA